MGHSLNQINPTSSPKPSTYIKIISLVIFSSGDVQTVSFAELHSPLSFFLLEDVLSWGTHCKLIFWNFPEDLILMHIQETCKICLSWNGNTLPIVCSAGIIQLLELDENIVNANTSDPRITWIYHFWGQSLSQDTCTWTLAHRHWDPFQINPCYWCHLALNEERSAFPVVCSLVHGKSYLVINNKLLRTVGRISNL